jgi:hypothetical protein
LEKDTLIDHEFLLLTSLLHPLHLILVHVLGLGMSLLSPISVSIFGRAISLSDSLHINQAKSLLQVKRGDGEVRLDTVRQDGEESRRCVLQVKRGHQPGHGVINQAKGVLQVKIDSWV